MKKSLLLLVPIVALFVGFSTVHAAYFADINNTNGSVEISTPVNDDAFIAGNGLQINAPVSGELFAFGNSVTVDKPIGRSIISAGNIVNINNGSGYNAFVVGNAVTLKGDFGHDVYVAGSSVVLDSSSVIHGSLFVAGGDVVLYGSITGDVHFTTGSFTSNAVIGGNLDGSSGGSKNNSSNPIFFTGGSIAKDFTYRSNQVAAGLTTVKISGQTQRSNYPVKNNSTSITLQGLFFSALMLIVLGAAMIAFAPKQIEAIQDSVRKNWGKNALNGLLTVIVTPIIILLLMFTIIGIPLALILIALYGVLIAMCGVVSTIMIGQYLLRLSKITSSIWLALVVGVIVTVALKSTVWLALITGLVIGVGLILPAIGASLTWFKERFHS